jgi:glutamine amidotransferase-like uncharacterized protein
MNSEEMNGEDSSVNDLDDLDSTVSVPNQEQITIEPDNSDKEPLRVVIYAGAGSWDENVITLQYFFEEYGYSWSTIDENISPGKNFNEEFELIWFPGGFASEYRYDSLDHELIRSFVKNGGVFVGSCAGAYYASERLLWLYTDDGEPVEIEYPLKLFKGVAVGPLVGFINWGDKASLNLAEDHPANINFNSAIEIYYMDGPYFEPEREDTVEILARYKANNKPAAIAGRYGDGKYLLLGPHPEFGDYYQDILDLDKNNAETVQWLWLQSVLEWLIDW